MAGSSLEIRTDVARANDLIAEAQTLMKASAEKLDEAINAYLRVESTKLESAVQIARTTSSNIMENTGFLYGAIQTANQYASTV